MATDPGRRAIDSRDLTLLCGLALVSFGMWFVWPPGAAIVPGLILTAVSVFGVR